jgi:Uma2 family endonuclease
VKQGIYAGANIQEYWVFDLEARALKVFRDVNNGNYQIDVVWTETEIALQAIANICLNAEQLRTRMND